MRAAPFVTLGFCLLFVFLLFFIAPAAGTRGQTLSSCAIAPSGQELVNYGRRWNAWSGESRSIYLEGFVDGQSHTYLLLTNDLPKDRRESLRMQTFTFYDGSAIRDVMTSLYSDPANTYITFDSMVYIARDKLAGQDIESRLREARKSDCGFTDR